MGNGFRKFSRKLRAGALWRSIFFGASVGGLLAAALMLLAKLTAAEPDFARYAVIAGVTAVVLAGLMYLILLPTRRRMAKKIDRALGLGEKVQTMVAFRHDSTDMATLQRQDTDRILTEAPKRKVKGACTWLFVLLPAVACLAMVGTILVPAAEPDQPPPTVDNAFSFTPWQQQALQDLIDKVKKSDMEAAPREGVVKELESLLIQLKTVKKESTMKEIVIGTIQSIDAIVDDHNTYDLVAQALGNSPMTAVQKMGNSIYSLKPLLIHETMNTLRESMAGGEGQADPTITASALATALTMACDNAHLPADQAVIAALTAFAEGLQAASQTSGDALQEDLDDLFSESTQALNNALAVQAANEQIGLDTVYSLMSIFGISKEDVPEEVFEKAEGVNSAGNEYDDDDDDRELNSGGAGSGEMLYGSDDRIYDPVTDAYVTYGEVINRYYAGITEQLVDGNLSPELEEILTDYFAFLFTASKKDSE